MSASSSSIVKTEDGSHTLYSDRHNAHYHSVHGAITESEQLFIRDGFRYISQRFPRVSVLEIGLGTGLNAALTASKAIANNIETSYYGLELYPPPVNLLKRLNYSTLLPYPAAKLWERIIGLSWEKLHSLHSSFSIHKSQCDYLTWIPDHRYNLIYFDAFAPDDQPEMWSPERFTTLYRSLEKDGILLTYSSKGIVKQALRHAGFTVKRLPGPPGKRHIIRAHKTE